MYEREQESFINISVPKIDKDYSLYRTYVIFRTLGLRHLVVVDVHNHVVGIITRKDLMPFNMVERLETLLEHQTSADDDDDKYSANYDVQRKSAGSAEAIYVCDKMTYSADLPASVLLPSLKRKSSMHRSTLDGLEEEDEADSTSAAAVAGDSDGGRNDIAPAVQVVVTAPSKGGKQDWV